MNVPKRCLKTSKAVDNVKRTFSTGFDLPHAHPSTRDLKEQVLQNWRR